MTRTIEFNSQVDAIKQATPANPAQAIKTAPKTQGSGS